MKRIILLFLYFYEYIIIAHSDSLLVWGLEVNILYDLIWSVYEVLASFIFFFVLFFV